MKLFKKGGQKYQNILGKVTGEYEIKTFKGNQRIRSPIGPPFLPMRRSPNIKKNSQNSDSNLGEMFYVEPNDANFGRGQNMSPLNDSNNLNTRSPLKEPNYEYNQGKMRTIAPNMNLIHTNRNYLMNNNNLDNSRSPKTINVGESPQEVDYNMRSIPQMRNNMNTGSPLPQNNYTGDRSYNMLLNDTGNIFLDQPMQQVGFNNQLNENDGIRDNPLSRGECQIPPIRTDFQEQSPGILQKMSPKQNVEGESDTNSEKNDNVNEINDLKTQLDRNMHVMLKNEDGIGLGDKNIRNRGDMENIEIMAKSKEFQENSNSENVKKLIKYYVKTYDPRRGEDGNLISNSQVIIASNQDRLFNERYKVLQKMNKLSNILLSKRKGSIDSSELNRSFNNEDQKNKFDRNTLTNAKLLDKKSHTRMPTRKNKFLYVSLAMLSAKGPNTEDRTIFRKMRLDKGGVVDLAQENIQKKSKFKIKKARTGGRGITAVNPKYREKAAKIVQTWWRERKQKYKRILEQIIKIQSFWRGKFTRKYIYDVIYISYLQEKFLSIMRNVLVNHVRPYVFDELFSKNKLIKDVLGELLLKLDMKNSLIKLQEYFNKWRDTSDLLSLRLFKSKQLVDKKEKDEEKLSILKKYFDKWNTIKNLSKYIGEAKNAEEKRKKFFGTLNIVNGLSSLTKRQIFKTTKGPITSYLKDLLRQKLLLKITKKIYTRCLNDKLKNYLNKWRLGAKEKKLDDFRNEQFINKMINIKSRIDKNKIKDGFNKLKALIPKYLNLMKIKNGFKHLEKTLQKKNIKYPIETLKEKLNKNDKDLSAKKFFSFKRKNLNVSLKQFFDDWKNRRVKLEEKDKRNEVYNHLLKNIINKIQKRILYNKFNQWKKKPKVDINSEIQKINNICNSLKKGINNSLNGDKKLFLDKLNKTRDKHTLNNATNKIHDVINNKRKLILKYYFYKLRSDVKNEEIKDLHRQLLKYIISSMNLKNNRNNLAKYLSKWKLFIEGNKNNDHLDKLKSIIKGGDLLDKIYKRRNLDLMKRLYQKLSTDHRPKILAKLIKNLDKPRSSLRDCLNNWRRIANLKKADDIILKYKAKIVKVNANTIKFRDDKSKLMKAFYHWKQMSRKPDEYYPKINNLLNSIKNYAKKKATKEPFTKIKNSKNPERYLLKLLKNKNNQDARLLDGKLRNLLGRWRKQTFEDKSSDLKAKILYNLKVYLNDIQKKKLLSKYLTKWKGNSEKKGININFYKAINRLINLFRKKFKPDLFDAFYKKAKDLDKKLKLNNLMDILQKNHNNKLHTIFLSLWKKILNIDPDKDNKIQSKLKKIIKRNELIPLLNPLRKWAKILNLFKLNDIKKNHAIEIIVRILKNHDKINLIRALNLIKENLHKKREQYLKALLIKQIKTSQNSKEKMTKENKLRMALLKWRSNVISMNYIDNLKKIRKGCKLLKLGLKKKHEKDIINNIKDIKRKQLLNNILKKIFDNMVNNLNEQRKKSAFNKWKNILENIKQEKNKMKDIFDKYIFSDKIHQNLFSKPKLDLLTLAREYDEKKKKSAVKIVKFIKKIIRIKERNKIMERNKLLNKIIKRKNDIMDSLKKIMLMRFHIQAQKIKNHENAKTIQKYAKIKLKKYLKKKQLIKEGLDNLDLFVKRHEFNKIKNNSNDKLRMQLLTKITNKKDDTTNTILKDKLKEWKNKANLVKKVVSTIKIQTAIRKSIAKNNLDNIKRKNSLLKKDIENCENKKKIRLSYVLRDWLHKAILIRNNTSAKKIQDKFRETILKKNNEEKAKKILQIEKRKSNIFNIMGKARQFQALNKISENIKKIAGEKVLEKILKKKPKKVKFAENIKIKQIKRSKKDNLLLRKYLLRWKKITNKKKARDDKFRNALNIIDKRQVINYANDIDKIMTIKKLIHDMPYVRAKLFLQKIKKKSENVEKFNKLKEALLKAKDDLDKNKKKLFMEKIAKIYYYNTIKNNLINGCNKYDQRLKQIYGKEFFNKLLEIKAKNLAFNYNNELESTKKPKITKLKFKKECSDPNNYKDKIISDKNAPMKKILPSLINYLNDKIKRRNEETFEKIKKESINKKFAQIFKSFVKKTFSPKKLQILTQMKRDVKYSEIRPKTQIKLFKLFRRKYIKDITSSLVEPSRLYRLYYLFNITKMHANISNQRYYRELIRKWRFITFSKKMTRKKLELMYKNLHASYLQMADEIFGEDKLNPSLFKEFERFGANIGMFTGQEPNIDEELNKKYYTDVNKKYIFTTKASGKLSEFQNIKKEEFEDKLNEGKSVEVNKRDAQSSKNIKEQFDSMKQSGISKSYFAKDEKK